MPFNNKNVQVLEQVKCFSVENFWLNNC